MTNNGGRGVQVPADAYMRTARNRADAILDGYHREARAAGADKARGRTADARAARLVQHRQKQGAGTNVRCVDRLSGLR